MSTDSKNKLEKYVPVRKQLKTANNVTICQKEAANDSHSEHKPTLPEAA